MTAVSAPRPGWELLAGQVNQRRYEALRAYLFEGASLQQAADATGYTRAAVASLVRDLRAGRLTVFAAPGTPGRKSAPKKDAARGRAVELRRAGLSVYEISARLGQEGTPLGRSAVSDILREEGFGRLLRGPAPEASTSPATSGRGTRLPPAAVIDFAALPARAHTTMAGLLLAIPDLVALDLPALAAAAGYPGTRVIPASPGCCPCSRSSSPRPGGSPMSMTCSPIPPPRCWPGCRSCRRRPRSPITPTGYPMTTSCGSWPPWTSR